MGKTVFHLDDDADDRNAVKVILEKEKYTVRSFENTKELISTISKSLPDLIILDVMLEEHDSGLKLYDKIIRKYPDKKLILLTALGKMVSSYFKGRSKHVRVLEKPILPKSLIAAVQLKLS
jgi:DNA-binding NtrC family response regulator